MMTAAMTTLEQPQRTLAREGAVGVAEVVEVEEAVEVEEVEEMILQETVDPNQTKITPRYHLVNTQSVIITSLRCYEQ